MKKDYDSTRIYRNTHKKRVRHRLMTHPLKDDTLLFESDIIYDESIVKKLLDNTWPNLALVAKWEYWMDGTVVKIDNENNILSFVSKDMFNFHDTDDYYKTINIYKFSKEFARNKYIPFLNAYCQAWGNNEYYEQVLKVLTFLNRTELKALPISDEKWYEIDDIQDLDIAETIFSDEQNIAQKYHKRYGGFWRFPKLLDFCYLVNPFFPTKQLKEEMKANYDTLLTEYPSGMYVNSLLASKYFDIKRNYIVVGNGAAELIKSMLENINGKYGIIYPTFEEYPNRLSKEDIVPFVSSKEDFHYTADDLIRFYADKEIEYLVLINPDNPSGNFVPTKDVLRLSNWCKEHSIKLIVDESFVDFSDNFESNSLIHNDILEGNPNLIVIKSISKSYGVPGLRLGILATSDEKIIDCIKKNIAIWNINSFAEYYMQIFGKYQKYYREACYLFIKERERFQKEMDKVSFVRVIPSQANFFMIELTGRYTSNELSSVLPQIRNL